MPTAILQTSAISQIVSLYEHSYRPVIAHFLAAGLLVYITWGMVSIDVVFQWLSLLISALLLSVLSFSMFHRKRQTQNVNYTHWENYLAVSTVLICAVFAVAYAYLLVLFDTALHALIGFILAMHLSCVVVGNVNSRKVMLWTAVTLTLPVIAAFVWIANAQAWSIAASFGVFVCLMLWTSFTVNTLICTGFQVSHQYVDTLELANKYKYKLETSTIEDPQTQIFNRRFFDLIINAEVRRAKRAGNNLTLALIKIDCFDEYLNGYGHDKADKCLRKVAKLLANATPRGGEYMTRFDKDTFALIVPNVCTAEAVAFAAKMMGVVHNAQIEHKDTQVEHRHTVSITVGIAEFKPGNIINVEEIIDQATQALNTGIAMGLNNCQVYATEAQNNEALTNSNSSDSQPSVEQKHGLTLVDNKRTSIA